MATKLINLPLSAKYSMEQSLIARHQGVDLTKRLQETSANALIEYDLLRAQGFQVDSALPIVEPSRSDIALILYRPDDEPFTISQKYAQATQEAVQFERALGIEFDNKVDLASRIATIHATMQQQINELAAKLAAMQPIGELNGTEEN